MLTEQCCILRPMIYSWIKVDVTNSYSHICNYLQTEGTYAYTVVTRCMLAEEVLWVVFFWLFFFYYRRCCRLYRMHWQWRVWEFKVIRCWEGRGGHGCSKSLGGWCSAYCQSRDTCEWKHFPCWPNYHSTTFIVTLHFNKPDTWQVSMWKAI